MNEPQPAAEPTEPVLIVDDEKNIRRTLRMVLEGGGSTVYEAGTIAEAQDLLNRHEIDLVLLDVKLGEENGIDLLRAGSALDSGATEARPPIAGIRAVEGLRRDVPDRRNLRPRKPAGAKLIVRDRADVVRSAARPHLAMADFSPSQTFLAGSMREVMAWPDFISNSSAWGRNSRMKSAEP